MNVLVIGATGVIGRQAIPRLREAGHEVAGLARSAAAARWLGAVGATPVQVDLFDPAMVASAVANANAAVHLATAIPPLARMRRPGAWHTNDRLRTHATRNLVDAAIAASAEVLVHESVSFNDANGGAAWLDESATVHPLGRRCAGDGTAVDRVAGGHARRTAASPASRVGRTQVAWRHGRPARGLPAGLQPSLPPGGGLGTPLPERGGRMANGWHPAFAIRMSRQVVTLARLPAVAWLRHTSHGTRPEELSQWR
jgi:hypothetical protein